MDPDVPEVVWIFIADLVAFHPCLSSFLLISAKSECPNYSVGLLDLMDV